MNSEIHLILDNIPFFKGISPQATAAVSQRLVPRNAGAGTVLFRRGEAPRGVYILVDGEVEIYRTTSDGREQIIHTEHPVKLVAELPMLDGQSYPAAGRASRNSRLYFLSQDDFRRLYREHPEITDQIIMTLGTRLRQLIGVLEKVSLREVPSRVAMVLLECARDAGVLHNGGTFSMPRTQGQLASELATSRETVARALAAFRAAGWIRQRGREVELLNSGALENVVRDGF